MEAVTNASQNLSNMPVEVMEAEHPVRVEEYAFVPDSCGAGRWRGGVGLRRTYRILADEALLQMRTDRVAFAPYGLDGGSPGGRTRNTMTRDGTHQALPGKLTTSVTHGTVIVHEQAGGGGHGDPLQRDADAVLEDVLDGKITADFARREHAVAVREARIDAAETARLRAEARQQRHSAHGNDKGQ